MGVCFVGAGVMGVQELYPNPGHLPFLTSTFNRKPSSPAAL